MTPNSAARKLERIEAGRKLSLDADVSNPAAESVAASVAPANQSIPGIQFVGRPTSQDAPGQPGGPIPNRYMPPGEDEIPAVPAGPAKDVPARAPEAPAPAAPGQPTVLQPTQQQPVATNQLPAAQVSAPAANPAAPPGPDIFGLPNTEGRKEGDEWDEMLPDGRIVHNRIPFGNGNQTVDQSIPDGKGGFTQSRVAGNGQGGWQRWNVNADGTAFYGSKDTAGSAMLGLDFDSGSSTAGLPDRAYQRTPDYKGIQTPSYDASGNLVGVDVAVPNKYGLYDNYHYDNYGNLTISKATPDGKGGVNSTFVAQIDSNDEGWEVDELGHRWDVGKDLLGRPTRGRTEQTDQGTHVYFVDHRGVLFDTFYGDAADSSYTDIYNDDETITRRFRDGTWVTFDRNLNVKEYKGPPDRRDFVQKGVDALGDIGSSLRSWASDSTGMFRYGTGLRAGADPTNPAKQAAVAQQWERSSNAIGAASNFIVDSAVYPVITLYDWGRYTIGGSLIGLAGDPITPSGRARHQAAQEYMDKAPSTPETLLAATTFLVPEFGTPARLGATAARGAVAEAATVGSRALSSGAGVGRLGAVPIGSGWMTAADLSLDWSAPLRARLFESFSVAASTSLPARGIIKFEAIPSGTRALTSADLPMNWSVPFGRKVFEQQLFTGTSLGSRRALDLPEDLIGRRRIPAGRALADPKSVPDPRQLGISTFPLSKSSNSALVASDIPERQLVTAGRSGAADAAEHQADIVLQAQSVRVMNHAPSGPPQTGAGATRQTSSAGASSTSGGAPSLGGGSGGTRPPSGSGGTGADEIPSGRLLIGYQPPKAINQPAQKLDHVAFTNTYKPRPGRPPLKSDTHYVYVDKNGRKTTIVTGSDGAPVYIETWGSRSRAGTTTGKITYNPLLRDPLPNVVYRINKEFLVRTDMFARPVEGYNAGLRIVDKANRTRSESQQRSFNAKVRRSGTISGRSVDAGHTFRDMFGSPAEHLMYTPQRSAVNQGGGEFYEMEEDIRLILEATANHTPSGRVEYSILKGYDKNPPTARRAAGDELIPLKYDVLFREVGTSPWEVKRIFNV
ncbi:hypothetical protein ABZ540_23690 [Nocardia xishanensis]|uniref:hypothetical protein n=1 Tax=Nocardia xishanensis TaxID=238964 RepID=UPI003402194B